MSHQRSFVGQGSNSALVGDFNARVVLTALRRLGPASKADLSRIVGLTNNATGVIARKLERDGLVCNVGKRHGERGQPATMLDLNPRGAFSIGVRLDRSVLETVLVDLRGKVLARDRLDELPEPERAVLHLSTVIEAIIDRLEPACRARLNGIGVAAPYDLDSWLAELGLPAERFQRWGGFDLAGRLTAATGLPVVLENDGSAAAVGELIYGHGRHIADFLYLFVGPAIGGGVVLGGDYYRGPNRNAGDIGVVPVGPSTLQSAAHRRPTMLMARASTSALLRHLQATRNEHAKIDLPNEINSPAFIEWRDDAADAMAWPVLTSTHLLDVRHVVIGGDLPDVALHGLAAELQRRLAAIVAERRSCPTVLASRAGSDAAAVGAASLPLHLNFSPVRDGLVSQPVAAEVAT